MDYDIVELVEVCTIIGTIYVYIETDKYSAVK